MMIASKMLIKIFLCDHLFRVLPFLLMSRSLEISPTHTLMFVLLFKLCSFSIQKFITSFFFIFIYTHKLLLHRVVDIVWGRNDWGGGVEMGAK